MRGPFAASLIVALAILGLLAHFALTAPKPPPPLRLMVRPHIALAPSDITVYVRLVPDGNDRAMRVELDGGEFFRSSEWILDGAESPKVFQVGWRHVPDGDYQVVASVAVDEAMKHVRATAIEHVILTAPGVTDAR